MTDEQPAYLKYNSFREFIEGYYGKEELANIAENGVNCGYSYLTFYKDTCALYDRFHGDIWKMLEEDREEQGYKNIFELMATSGVANTVGNDCTFKNLLVWYAAEKVANEVMSETEAPEEE